MIEKELRANWDSVFYPQPDDEPEGQTFGDEVQPVEPPVLLAQGPTEGPGGAVFGFFPQMKPRRAGRSEVGENLPVLAADVVAGAGKGLVSGAVGMPGDILAIGRGLYEIGRRGGDESKLDAFLRGMDDGTIVPTSDDVDKWLTKTFGPVVPPGNVMQTQREAAAGAGRLAGEVVADPFVAVKAAKPLAKGAKALLPKIGEMLDQYMQRTGMQANLVAYHGSSKKFEKFDPKKIGTGEGVQAYGYGLYFSESRDVAKGFKVAVPDKGPGALYTVDVPDSLVRKMIEWDKPISQQPQNVKDALANSVFAGTEMTGKEVYERIGSMLSKGTKEKQGQAASRFFAEKGVPGVRYIEKNAGNVVVFPGSEDQIKIIKTEGGQ